MSASTLSEFKCRMLLAFLCNCTRLFPFSLRRCCRHSPVAFHTTANTSGFSSTPHTTSTFALCRASTLHSGGLSDADAGQLKSGPIAHHRVPFPVDLPNLNTDFLSARCAKLRFTLTSDRTKRRNIRSIVKSHQTHAT